ncbi:hypothetical protein [Spongiimicrobium salis]|uniref:hypothetical protein n=1 Tax=Spongiimicrobium salis TaxID=1667022 RepID=UPI00374CC770
MKKGLFLFLFFINFGLLAQNSPCSITLNNGEISEGHCDIESKKKILFKLPESNVVFSFGAEEFKQVIFHEPQDERIFQFVQVKTRSKKKKKFLLMERLETGHISLFQHYTSKLALIKGTAIGYDNNGISVRPNVGFQREKTIEKYIKIANTEIAIDLNDSEKIMDILERCFADCPGVLEELKIIGYEGNNLNDLVWQYNRDCSKSKKK